MPLTDFQIRALLFGLMVVIDLILFVFLVGQIDDEAANESVIAIISAIVGGLTSTISMGARDIFVHQPDDPDQIDSKQR